MTHKLKLMSWALAAIFTMSAIAASGAQASGAHFRVNGGAAGKYVITATADAQDPLQTFSVDGGEVECDIVNAKGTLETGTTSVITLNEVEYASDFLEENGPCEAFGLEAEVNFNGCHLTLRAGTWNPGANDSTGTKDINCTPGKGPITITTPVCTVTVPAQEGIGPITYTNVAGTPDDVTIDTDADDIKYSEAGSLCKSETKENGVFDGNLTLRAFEDELGQEGNRVSLTVVDGGT